MLVEVNGRVLIVNTVKRDNGQDIIQISADGINRRAAVHTEIPKTDEGIPNAAVFVEDSHLVGKSSARKLGEFALEPALSMAQMWVASGTTPSRFTLSLMDVSKRC